MLSAVLHGKRDIRFLEKTDPRPGPNDVVIKVVVGGICGSDLHYFQHAANGTIVMREPLILGHEIAGLIAAVGESVTGLQVGQKAAIDPTRVCGRCRACREGHALHCENGTFLGSAMRYPHTQGGFRESFVCDQSQVFPVAESVDFKDLVFAEPLAVCLHAVGRAGTLFGQRVLVTGAGPIGNLIVMLARQAGAAEIVSTDINPKALAYATAAGADKTVNVTDEHALTALVKADGQFDVAFECSGQAVAITAAIDAVRARGTIVQVGMLGRSVPAALGAIVLKEIDYRGTFRFDREFEQAVRMIERGGFDLQPLISHRMPFRDIAGALEVASDRDRAMKVQVTFD